MNADESAESAVLGACLLNRRAAETATEVLKPPDFFSPARGLIFAAIQVVLDRSGQVDAVSVGLELGDKLEDCGGMSYVNSLSGLCPSFTQIRDYAQAVRDRSLERRIERVYEEVSGNGTRGQEALEALQERLYDLEPAEVHSYTLSQGFEHLFTEAENPPTAQCQFPWNELQMWTRGLRPGWLYYLAGEASHGKTAAALAVVEANVKAGRRVLFDSLEMTVDQLAVRIAQRHGLSSDRFYAGKAKAEDFQSLVNLMGMEEWKRVRVEAMPGMSRLISAVRRYKPDLLVVDYLQLMEIGRESRVEGTSRNSHGLKWDIARRFNIPVLCLSQISRDRTQRNHMPALDRLKDSSSIEQDADCIIFCWRKRDDNDELTPEGTFLVAKSRMGRTGSVRFNFDGDTQEFRVVTSYMPGS